MNFRNTRLAKLDAPDGPYAALILAKAGLMRLGMSDRITCDLNPPTLLHAVSQGALAVEIRSNDLESIELCKVLTHWPTQWRCVAERGLLRVLEGGCSVPVGVSTELRVRGDATPGGVLKITGCVTGINGDMHVENTLEEEVSNLEEAEKLGERLAKILIDIGAGEILDEINQDRDRRVGEAKVADEVEKIEQALE